MGFCRAKENIEADSPGIECWFLRNKGNVFPVFLNIKARDIMSVKLVIMMLVSPFRKSKGKFID